LEDRLAPATISVNTTADNTSDTSVLTLRDAITLVNNAGDPTSLGQSSMPAGWASQIDTTNPFGSNDTIQFNIPWTDPGHVYYRGQVSSGNVTLVPLNTTSDADLANVALVGNGNTIAAAWAHSWWSIQLSSTEDSSQSLDGWTGALPAITNPVVIDGYSQSGASPNTVTNGDNAVLRIEITGKNLPSPTAYTSGLLLRASNSRIQGLALNGFIQEDGVNVDGGSRNHISGDFIGTDVSGTLAPDVMGTRNPNESTMVPDGRPDYSSVLIPTNVTDIGVRLVNAAYKNWIGGDGTSAAQDAADRNLTESSVAKVTALQL
jgi:hypothetical protein